MSLHEQLLAAVQPPAGTPLADLDPNSWLAALRAVVELHAPDTELPNACGTCCCSSWPCSTVQAIARELGIEAGEGRG